MKKPRLRQQALIYSFFAFLYIVLVSLLMTNGEKLFGNNNILAPVGVLLLFVLSAIIMASLIFGKAIIMYLNGDKKDSIKLVIYNIICLFIHIVIHYVLIICYNAFSF